MSYVVYKHTCPNGKVYIGITGKNPIKRWCNGNGYKHNIHFTSAINKYGWDNIKHEILYAELDKSTACQYEKELIDEHNSTNREFGYNKSIGGELSAFGVKMSEETKDKIRKKRTGIKLSQETKDKIADANRRRSQETLDKISASLKGRKSWNKGITGKESHSFGVVFTNERKNNISIANKGKNHGVSKRVKHIESGMIYDSVSLAAKSLNLNVSGISKCCTGKLKSYHKQHFEYIGEF